ncbi:amino acid permease, partial [Bacillus sp. D-CC]
MQQKKWGFWVLTAFVVGNMVGTMKIPAPTMLPTTKAV